MVSSIGRWKRWRRKRTLASRPIPDNLWSATLEHYPFLQAHPAEDLQRLRALATLFLAEKEFSGAGGLEVTDAMAVAIAAQACVPVLELGLEAYSRFVGIVVHPGAMAARRESIDDAGVVHHYLEELTGETIDGGPLTLAWSDVDDAGTTASWGYNVVIHEFTHVLDLHAARASQTGIDSAWAARLGAEYERFAARIERGDETWLDPYGAETIEEYFAVAAEAFFVAPRELRHYEPRVYPLLRDFFRQDPAQLSDNRPEQKKGSRSSLS